jgi:hypothetical protein
MDGKLGTGDIDKLYMTILNNAFESAHIGTAKSILGTIVLGQIALQDIDIQNLLGETMGT